MNIIMLKPTQFRSKFYSRGKSYPVENEQGNRWIKRKIAVLDTREEMAVGPEKPEMLEGIKSFSEAGNPIAEAFDIKPEVDPENNGTPNIKELKLMAKAAGIPGYSRMSKGQLLEALDGDNNAS